MKYFRQILLIFLFSCLGELLNHLIPLPIPASIYGMVLLFAALGLKLITVASVSDTGNFLVSTLPVLFVTPLVSLMDHWDAIKGSIVPILIVIIGSTLLVFAVSGWVTQLLMRSKEGDGHA